MDSIASQSVPEQGQLVTCRQRQYVVTDVAKSALPERPLQPSGNGAQHLVGLSSIEDDAFGEELQVVWELEPGARVVEKVALPSAMDLEEPERLDAEPVAGDDRMGGRVEIDRN